MLIASLIMLIASLIIMISSFIMLIASLIRQVDFAVGCRDGLLDDLVQCQLQPE